ncbi:MAG: 4-hydroxythreonine-4-phosphate dehydrogenase PdxA [Litorivicinaceae bacterium]
MTTKTIALIQGDPGGIGPELLIKLLNHDGVREAANLLVIGAPSIFTRGQRQTGITIPNVRHISEHDPLHFSNREILHLDLEIDGIDSTTVSHVSAAGGASSIAGLQCAFSLSQKGLVDGVVFMPFNKESMHLGGNNFTDELGFAKEFFGIKTCASEFNVANGMWNGRITSHVAMRDVSSLLTIPAIVDGIALTDQTLKMAGYDNPRIVVAAYNPHAGDNGLMGDEEIRVIGPAVKQAQADGIQCSGPFPADTLWLKVRAGEYDAVVTMYHDQGQIAIKLLGFEKGVSVLAGLPLPLTTPAHGTAFDIAGQGVANLVPTHNAFTMCLNMASNRHAIEGVDSAA